MFIAEKGALWDGGFEQEQGHDWDRFYSGDGQEEGCYSR